MIPYKWPVLTAVPPLEKRLEIVQAMQELSEQIEADRHRRQQAEIDARRRLIEQIVPTVHELWCRCHPLARSYVLKYSPDQPRVPAGSPQGGEWTSEGGSESSSESTTRFGAADDGTSNSGTQYAALDTGTRTDATESAPPEPHVVLASNGWQNLPVNLAEEEAPNGIGHTISDHVGSLSKS